jgi:hypothetical protein
MTGLPIVRQRPPDFKPAARPETEANPDAPCIPVTLWDFIDSRCLDKDEPEIEWQSIGPSMHITRDDRVSRSEGGEEGCCCGQTPWTS